MGSRRIYSREFKREAVELANQPGQTVAQVARDLGIRAKMPSRWRREASEHGGRLVGKVLRVMRNSCAYAASCPKLRRNVIF